MIGILLTILKVIGIILLVLITFILLVAALVLFVPIRYSVQGYYREDYQLHAKITWFLHILSMNACLVNGKALQLLIRIFGIPVYDSSKPPKKARSKKAKTVQDNNSELHAASKDSKSNSLSSKSIDTESVSKDTIHKNAQYTDKENMTTIDQDTSNTSSKKFSLFQKISFFIRNIIQFLQNIKYTFKRFYDTIVDIKSNVHYYCDLLSQDTTKAAFSACTKQLQRILKNLKPKQWRIYLHIGMDDPAAMGNILGIWGMFYPLHEGHIELEPDFEHYVMENDFFLKGRITFYVYLWTAYIILFDKNIKHLRKCLLREEG